jgi:hypothetical protein
MRRDAPSNPRAPGLLAGLLALCLLAACRAPAPGQDALTLRAQQMLAASFAVVDAFLAWEYAARPEEPEVRAAAELLRREFPPTHRLAAQLLRAWQTAGASDTRDALERTLKRLEALEDVAREHLRQITHTPVPAR